MAISFTKYVNIVSGVGGGAAVARRDLIGRIFTVNELLPPGSFIEFTDLASVGAYFGTSSEEYARASFYFGWVSKNITRPKTLSFARWVETAQPPQIYGARLTALLAAFTAITTGSFSLTLGADTNIMSALDFSGAASLAAVATIIQTSIRTKTGIQWTGATVTYDSTRGAFIFGGGSAVAAKITVAPGITGVDVSGLIGWLPESVTGAIWSDGAIVETLTDVLTNSTDASNNFGSFLFMPVLNLTQIEEVATWNTAQNVLFQYMVPVNAANASSYSAALINFAGVGMTLSVTAGEYPEQAPMMIMAATNYNARNSVQNYMFQVFNLTPSVTTTLASNAYDLLRVNYYGVTQTAGQLLAFYQRGVLSGLAVNPVDMNVYANESWLKDAAGAIIMQLLLALAKVSANETGRGQILIVVQSVVDEALNNGTVSVGKQLNVTQQLYITEVTGDPNAWRQVQTIGYWVDCFISTTVTPDGRTEYIANYVLVYSKDDVVRAVDGQHVLI